MDGEANMFTDVVEPLGTRLAAAGTDLDTAWKAARATILDSEALIGDDIMGGAFGTIYNADSAQIRAIADEAPGVMTVDGDLAVSLVPLYLAANEAGRAALADRIIDEA